MTGHTPLWAAAEHWFYAGGEWRESTGAARHDVVDPYRGTILSSVRSCSAADVDEAVRAAVSARAALSELSLPERAALVSALADPVSAHHEELAQLITSEIGAPISFSRETQVGAAVDMIRRLPGDAAQIIEVERIADAEVHRVGIGVVAAVTPWNYPLLQVIGKVMPALVAGCPVVLKPSEVAPLSVIALIRIIHDSGLLPPGAVNLVLGDGPGTGEALVTHPDVEMISFTGSTTAGRRISALAAERVRPTAMELGGKSASVLLDDLDGESLRTAVRRSLEECFANAGQTCSAWTRLLVPATLLSEVEDLVSAQVAGLVVGDPGQEATEVGPLVSARQRDRVRDHLRSGTAEGARLLVAGGTGGQDPDQAAFVPPTVFTDVSADMRLAQEEVFGPVLVLMPYDGEAEAIAVANGTDYGLAGAVWSGDSDRASRVARRIRAGVVSVNGGPEASGVPFGGFNQSGHGRESGKYAIEEFLTTQTLCF